MARRVYRSGQRAGGPVGRTLHELLHALLDDARVALEELGLALDELDLRLELELLLSLVE